MSFDDTRLGLSGQLKVFDAWRSRLAGRPYIYRDELPLSAMIGELAHVCVLSREAQGFRFRLAGSGLRLGLGREARGLMTSDLPFCRDQWSWSEALEQTLKDRAPVAGRTRTSQGEIHFWLRLPMTSNGRGADTILCHDRYLSIEALQDPDLAAHEANRRLRLDLLEPELV